MGDRPAGGTLRRRRVRQSKRAYQRRTTGEQDLTGRTSLLLALLVVAAVPAAAQDLSIWFDATTSHARPPADVPGTATTYGLLGARLLAAIGDVDVGVGASSGLSLGDAGEGRWVQGEVRARAGRRLGPASLRLTLSGYRLRYQEPFTYEAAGAEARPEVAFSTGRTVWVLAPRISAGEWAADTLEGVLRMAGGSLEMQRSVGPVDGYTRIELLDVENGATRGTFVRGVAGASLVRGRWALDAALEAQASPLETEVGGSVSAAASLAPWVALRLEAGRYLRDPLFGAPASVGVSAGLSVRPVRVRTPGPPPVAAVGAAVDGGREVRFTLRAPGAERVELTGDFTGWRPVPLERQGGYWTTRVTLSPGLHHFGFLVDGQWAIPEDAPGQVDDGWGRTNASVVVEP